MEHSQYSTSKEERASFDKSRRITETVTNLENFSREQIFFFFFFFAPASQDLNKGIFPRLADNYASPRKNITLIEKS